MTHADDIILIANKEEELKAIVKRLEHFIDRRKLNLNVKKSKATVFKKGGGEEKKRTGNGKVKG